MGAMKVLRAFAQIPRNRQSKAINKVIKQEVKKILENDIYKYLRAKDGLRKEKQGWTRFGFPLFYQSDVLEVLDILTKLGVYDQRMEPAIRLVLKKQTKDRVWLLRNTYNGKMWHDIDVKNQPSKWVTLRALRVLKRLATKKQ
ncbi:MAG: hypothetical protein ACTSW4_01285 [Candidatus Ranarchaeia archaeon]